jgi:hypothetical protein
MVGGAGGNPFAVDGQGVGNVGLHLKARLASTSRGPRIGLAAIASLYLPTIAPRDRFLGEDQWVPQLVGVVDKELGRERRLRLSLNGGIRLRRTTTFTNSDPGPAMAPVTGRSITVGSELPLGFGVAYALAPQRFDVVGEVFGAVPLGAHQSYQPLEALAGVKLYLARNSFLTLGAGRGLLADRDGNPALRAFIGIVFEPSVGDRDGDGIKDDLDRCPDAPEDFDGWEDEDGCPDPDNDHDGIPDEKDKCPNEPETINGFQDDDGCPDKGDSTIVLSPDRIETLDPIQFNGLKLTRQSIPFIEQVGATLRAHPEIIRLRVTVHVQPTRDQDADQTRSEKRAQAIRDWLVQWGIAPTRLEARGFGGTKPLVPPDQRGAAKVNDRLELIILERK